MSGAVLVVPYDPGWPNQFETISARLAAVLDGVDVVSIEHVGSTSVPGLAAKPVIDIDVVVERIDVAPALTALEAVGYHSLGEMGVPERHACKAPAGSIRQNVYVTVNGCLSLRNHLGVRSVLRSRSDLRDEYGAIKLALADQVANIDEYVAGKTDILLRVLYEAGLTADEMEELEAINRLQQSPRSEESRDDR